MNKTTLKRWIKQNGLTNAAAADRLGVSVRCLMYWKAGRYPVRSSAAARILKEKHPTTSGVAIKPASFRPS